VRANASNARLLRRSELCRRWEGARCSIACCPRGALPRALRLCKRNKRRGKSVQREEEVVESARFSRQTLNSRRDWAAVMKD
jgi:hypothetical protein